MECHATTEKKITALLDRWNASLQTGDPKKVVTNYAEHSILLPTLSNQPRLTPEEKEAYFEHFSQKKPVGKIDFRDLEIDCNTAFDAGFIYLYLPRWNPSQNPLPVHLPREWKALADYQPAFLAPAGEGVSASVELSDHTRYFKPRARRTGYTLVLLAIALMLLPRSTPADAKSSALLEFTSNYVYRGYSKSNGAPGLQGNIDYEHSSGFFLGTWVSQVDFGHERYQGRANFEANPYVGGNLGLSENWRFGTTLAGYLYDGKIYGHAADYGEINAVLYFRDLLTAHVGVSYDAYGRGRSPLNYEIDLRYPVMATVDVSSGLGYEDANAVLNYSRVYGHIGASWFLDKHVALTLRYYDAQRLNELKGGAENTRFKYPRIDNHVVFSISIGF